MDRAFVGAGHIAGIDVGGIEAPSLRVVATRDPDAARASALAARADDAGVVPIPSTTGADRATANLAAACCRLVDDALDRLDGVADPGFER